MAVHQGWKRFNAFACGRRWGKSKYLTRRMAECALRGQHYGYFAATYKLLTGVWDEVAHALGPVAQVNKSERRIRLQTGGSIEFWTLEDEDAGRSRRYHEVGIDEAGLVKNLQTIWYEAIRPTLADYRGEAALCGTPKGRNFFWEAYTLGQDPLNLEWASWQMPTASNPYIAAEEIEAARLGMPDRSFRQEFLAEFIEEAGGVFRGVRDCVVDGRRSFAGEEPVTIGVDVARVEDFTVITAIDHKGRQLYHERFNQISWERQIARIGDVYGKFAKAKVILDSTGVGDPIFERLRQSQINVEAYQFTNASKEALIDNLAMLIESRSVELLDIPEQTHELLSYQYELTPSRNIRMNAPTGMHDDCVIGLALASWSLRPRVRKVLRVLGKGSEAA